MRTEDFYTYLRKREALRLQKASGAPWPWSDNEILNTYKFTNVKRDHDSHARKSLDDVHASLANASRRLVEIGAAERENERRNRLAKEEAARAVRVKARKEANKLIQARIEAARAVDDAIVDLEAALLAYNASLPPLIEQLAIAEGPDRARELKATLDRRLRQSVRLAIWKAAPGLAALLHVERDGTAHWAPLQRLAEMLPGPTSAASN